MAKIIFSSLENALVNLKYYLKKTDKEAKAVYDSIFDNKDLELDVSTFILDDLATISNQLQRVSDAAIVIENNIKYAKEKIHYLPDKRSLS